MALAAVIFSAAFLFAWTPTLSGSPYSWLGLLLPAVWSLGLATRKAGVLSLGLVALVFLSAGEAASGRLLLPAGAVALALAAWDVGLLAIRLPRERDTRRRFMTAQTTRALGVAALGMGAAVGFSFLRLGLPFWGLLGMLLAAWAALIALFKASARLYSSGGGEASGNLSSSSPSE